MSKNIEKGTTRVSSRHHDMDEKSSSPPSPPSLLLNRTRSKILLAQQIDSDVASSESLEKFIIPVTDDPDVLETTITTTIAAPLTLSERSTASIQQHKKQRAIVESTRKSVADTQRMIASTLASTSALLARNDEVLSASASLEKKWEEFQNSYQTMMSGLIGTIAASLGVSDALGKNHEHTITSLSNVVEHIQRANNIVVLTGAGVSVTSGIPTYRDADGTWTFGSANYTPQEIATWGMYEKETAQCWDYFSDRYIMCRDAVPNASHKALALFEKWCLEQNKQFRLVTQNIDNLHRRAGSTKPLEIHGNITCVRCTNTECETSSTLMKRNDEVHLKTNENMGNVPTCLSCGFKLRPHILFFDESYNEELYKSASTLSLLGECDLLLVIGTMCTTSLPNRIVATCGARKIPIIDINPNPNDDLNCAPLLQLIEKSDAALPEILSCLQKDGGGVDCAAKKSVD
jgi:NAD-dependent deacetylase